MKTSEDITSKLVLGTANFGQHYKGRMVSPDEQAKIWDYCRQVGIDTIDTAFAYGKMELPDDFKVITKIVVNGGLKRSYYGCLIHHIEDFDRLWPSLKVEKEIGSIDKIGISAYRPDEIYPIIEKNKLDIIQIPYNIDNTSAVGLLYLKGKVELHFRSIFGGGDLIKKYGAKKCLEFALDSIADRIVIGIDSLSQLKELIE